MGMVGNAMCAAERFRRAAGAPDVEYGLEFEIRVNGSDIPVGSYGRDLIGHDFGYWGTDPIRFPRYSLGEPNDFQAVAALLDRDFWHAIGYDSKQRIEVNFAKAFAEMGLAAA